VFSILDEVTIGAAVATREEEVRRLLTEREVRRQTRSRAPTTWSWRVEPGKEEEFEHLRGWYLSSLGDAPVAAATLSRGSHVGQPDTAHEASAQPSRARCRRPGPASRRRLSLVLGGALRASRALPRLGRHLLQLGGESRPR
jgi:hypothetical protein